MGGGRRGVATTDILGEGRFGRGRGYQQYEFRRMGLDLRDSRDRWTEAVDILFKAFTVESFSYEGWYYSFPGTTVLPKPWQKPYPPVWIVGQSLVSIDAAVSRGFKVLTGGAASPIGRIEERRQQFDDAILRDCPGNDLSFGIKQKIYITDTEEEAVQMAQHGLWNLRVSLSLRLGREQVKRGRVTAVPIEDEPCIEEPVRNNFLFGMAKQVTARLTRMQKEPKLEHLDCDFWLGDMPQDKVLRSMELFASDGCPISR